MVAGPLVDDGFAMHHVDSVTIHGGVFDEPNLEQPPFGEFSTKQAGCSHELEEYYIWSFL